MTGLRLKVVIRATCWGCLGLSGGDLIMARRQLLNSKQLAGRHQRQVTPGSECAESAPNERRLSYVRA